jgi:cob(I)alamin adenosyltransferase
MAREKIYTKVGDDGTTGLFYGGRVPKDSLLPTAYGTVDEAQAVMGVARAHLGRTHELNEVLIGLERDLYVLMAELATAPENRHKLEAGKSATDQSMIDRVERLIDSYSERFEPPTQFVVLNRLSDLLWTIARWQEGSSLAARTGTKGNS